MSKLVICNRCDKPIEKGGYPQEYLINNYHVECLKKMILEMDMVQFENERPLRFKRYNNEN